MNRKNEIIKLIAQYKIITGKELSSIIGCSLKTIQNNIKEINNEFDIIDATPNGYMFKTKYFSSDLYFDDVNDENSLLSALLLRKEKLDIDELAEEFYLSKTTIERKLLKIKSFILDFSLSLERSKNKVWISGKEKNKRSLIAFLISQEVENDFDRVTKSENILEGVDTNVIKNIILNVTNKYDYIIRDCCFYGLLANITICLYRCRTGSHVEEPPDNILNGECDEYKISYSIYQEYSKIWEINITENDILFLASLLQGQISSKKNRNSDNVLVVNGTFEESIREIVISTFTYYGLKINDDESIYNFSVHVKSLIKRARNNNQVENEMLLSIQRNCPFIYDVAVYIYNKIKDRYNVNISNEEIGYIAVHIGFLIENTNKNCINVLLLISSYSGIDEKVKEKLILTYGDSINIIEDPNKFSKQGIDLIVSSKDRNVFGTKNVVISPFYDLNDQEKVNDAIKECLKIKNELFTDIVYATFLSDKLFFRDNQIKTRDEALDFMTKAMIDEGVANEEFAACVKQREELSSTCFMNSFAIPHSLRFDAFKSRCCILLSDTGIKWDDSTIHIVILIAVRYHDRHIFMKMYDNIIQSLQNQKKLMEIVNAKSLNQFLNIVRSK